jgi:cytochrome c oxidase subunit 3
MASAIAHVDPSGGSTWDGGKLPFGARYGKLMMWFFLLTDAFTFSGLLISYGMIRYASSYWPDPEKVFNAFPGTHANLPLVFVGLMTFILIMSSVTMVLAVDAGHKGNRFGVIFYMILTLIGGAMFLGCQAWEWTHLIHGGTTILSNNLGPDGTPGPAHFGQFFFVITGFHGMHVFSGVLLNLMIFINTIKGVYDKNQDYEMVEKVGLYWHFVDLVWVFVFTFFYLI